MLVIPLLLGFMFLAAAATGLGRARMTTSFSAEDRAYRQVVSGQGFTPAQTDLPPTGSGMPTLPTRYVLGNAVKQVEVAGQNMPVIHEEQDQAILLDAAWHISAWPQTGDRAAIQGWFEEYVDSSEGKSVAVTALGLQPAGPP